MKISQIKQTNAEKNIYVKFYHDTNYWMKEEAIKLIDWLLSNYTIDKLHFDFEDYPHRDFVENYLKDKKLSYKSDVKLFNCLNGIFLKYDKIFTCLNADEYRCRFNIGNLADLKYKLNKQTENCKKLNYCEDCNNV